MKTNFNSFYRFLMAMMLMPILCACPEPDPIPGIDPEPTPEPILKSAIIGKWIALGAADSWITYDFTTTGRFNVVTMEKGVIEEAQQATNFYFIEGETLTGSYTHKDGKITYIDWKSTDVKNLEIKFQRSDNNTLIGEYTLNRVLMSISLEGGQSEIPLYRNISGSQDIKDFYSQNESIAKVNQDGEITAVSMGTTFVFFKTENGTGAIEVKVTSTPKTLSEIIKATWIYENLQDKEWQKTIFAENNYVYVEWRNAISGKIENADGQYKVDNAIDLVAFSVKTPYGLQINQEWQLTSVEELEIKYDAYSDGASVGSYSGQRLIGSTTIQLGESYQPNYEELLPNIPISSFGVKNLDIATVNDNGLIESVFVGMTYIDIFTPIGTAVFEVVVEAEKVDDLWPDYTDCFNLNKQDLKKQYPDREIVDYSFYVAMIDDGSNEYIGTIMFWPGSDGKFKNIDMLIKEGADLSKMYNYLSYKYVESSFSIPDNQYWYFYEKDENGKNIIGISLESSKIRYSKL